MSYIRVGFFKYILNKMLTWANSNNELIVNRPVIGP